MQDGKIDFAEFEQMMFEGTEKAVEGPSLRGSLGRLSRLGDYYAQTETHTLDAPPVGRVVG